MSSNAVFIILAYLVTVVVLGGLILASLVARNKVRRQMAERGLDRPRARRKIDC